MTDKLTAIEMKRLIELGWEFLQTGPEEWEWMLTDAVDGHVKARQGDVYWDLSMARIKKEETMAETLKPDIVLCERFAPFKDCWRTLVEVRPEPWYADQVGDKTKAGDPVVVVRQHEGTREIRVEIYDCEDGLNVTYTNGGVDVDAKKERGQRWFRDIRTCRTSLRALTVRFMARGSGDNLRLES